MLVKVSYFPNWEASGADGPYRVSPNLMVVIPHGRHVSMHYGRAPVDVASVGLTGLGGLGLVLLWRLPPLVMAEPRRRRWMHRSPRDPADVADPADSPDLVGQAAPASGHDERPWTEPGDPDDPAGEPPPE